MTNKTMCGRTSVRHHPLLLGLLSSWQNLSVVKSYSQVLLGLRFMNELQRADSEIHARGLHWRNWPPSQILPHHHGTSIQDHNCGLSSSRSAVQKVSRRHKQTALWSRWPFVSDHWKLGCQSSVLLATKINDGKEYQCHKIPPQMIHGAQEQGHESRLYHVEHQSSFNL